MNARPHAVLQTVHSTGFCWLANVVIRLLQHEQKKLVHRFQGMEMMCFHVSEEDVLPPHWGHVHVSELGKNYSGKKQRIFGKIGLIVHKLICG